MNVQAAQVYPETSSAQPIHIPPQSASIYSMQMTERLAIVTSNVFRSIEAELLKNAQIIEANENTRETPYSCAYYRSISASVRQDLDEGKDCGGLCCNECCGTMCICLVVGWVYAFPDIGCLPITLPLDCRRTWKRSSLMQAQKREINLLSECFSKHPTIETFRAYRKFILEHHKEYGDKARVVKWKKQLKEKKRISFRIKSN